MKNELAAFLSEYISLSETDMEVISSLSLHSNVFVGWRYFQKQESASVNPKFLKSFTFSA